MPRKNKISERNYLFLLNTLSLTNDQKIPERDFAVSKKNGKFYEHYFKSIAHRPGRGGNC
ncbi:hypothetical protein SAMN02927921_02785 [Sinomicrobium oceani]|uniref:Uncharacterized protein n=1 Tax=Sinomicrobium oceani TaxID=1150368 RepID=A0A1K1QSB9_9FLAO|nr:hypothetical protein SAMN02927921_02785 [Sinomicrobium oceani]